MAALIIHEWVAASGGSERVVDDLVAAYPDADLQVLWSDVDGRYPVPTYETWLAKTPLRHSKALALPFMLPTWRNLSAHQEYDWVLVSSHLFAHHARLRGSSLNKLVYAHTPARYIWSPELDRRGAGLAARFASRLLKPIDRRRAGEARSIAANSEFARDRIRHAWNRDAEVIYPPVDTERIVGVDWCDQLGAEDADKLNALPASFLLGASRFVPYKRLELVIEAGEAVGLPVVIAGSGPDEGRLRSRANTASVPVYFVGRPSDHLLYALYQRCTVYVFPAIEDFGIMPVEAMACGAVVVAPALGGASESVGMLSGGATFESASPSALRAAVSRADSVDRAGLPSRTLALSRASFQQRIREWVASYTETPVETRTDHG